MNLEQPELLTRVVDHERDGVICQPAGSEYSSVYHQPPSADFLHYTFFHSVIKIKMCALLLPDANLWTNHLALLLVSQCPFWAGNIFFSCSGVFIKAELRKVVDTLFFTRPKGCDWKEPNSGECLRKLCALVRSRLYEDLKCGKKIFFFSFFFLGCDGYFRCFEAVSSQQHHLLFFTWTCRSWNKMDSWRCIHNYSTSCSEEVLFEFLCEMYFPKDKPSGVYHKQKERAKIAQLLVN